MDHQWPYQNSELEEETIYIEKGELQGLNIPSVTIFNYTFFYFIIRFLL